MVWYESISTNTGVSLALMHGKGRAYARKQVMRSQDGADLG